MYLVQIYPVGYMCTWFRYILWAICVPRSDISCGLSVYLVQIYPVGYLVQIYPVDYMCIWFRYILWVICVPGTDISRGLYLVHNISATNFISCTRFRHFERNCGFILRLQNGHMEHESLYSRKHLFNSQISSMLTKKSLIYSQSPVSRFVTRIKTAV